MTIRGPFAVILVIVAALSLAANFLVLGFVAARFSDVREGSIERLAAFGARNFPPEIRQSIVADAALDRTGLRVALRDLRQARQAMFAAMRAEHFDPEALDRAFAEVRAKTQTLQALGQEVVAKAVADAPADVRGQIRPPAWLP